MNKTTIIILILFALAVIIAVLKKQREPSSNKTQDELLNEMSNEELIELANSISYPRTVAPGVSREILIALIKRHQNG